MNYRDEVGHIAIAAGRVFNPQVLRIDSFALDIRHSMIQGR